MFGKAIIVDNADYSAKNIGQVTFISDEPVTEIALSVEKTAINEYTFRVIYEPANTYQRDVVWEISSGTTYGSITEDGVLVIGTAALDSTITITATSVYNPEITAEYSGQFTWENPSDILLTDNLEISTDGTEIENANAFTSSFIEVEPATEITIENLNQTYRFLEYAADKSTVTSWRWMSNTITLEPTTHYIRICQKKDTRSSNYIKVKDSSGNYLYYLPKATLFGKYIINVGKPATSFKWTTNLSDNKGIVLYNSDGSYIETWLRKGTRTCKATSAFQYIVVPFEESYTDTFTINDTVFDKLTYNTLIY